MRHILLAFALVLFCAANANAQTAPLQVDSSRCTASSVPVWVTNSVGQNGTWYCSSDTPASTLPKIAVHVATNAALAATSTMTSAAGLWRDDFAAGNGAPPLFYTPSGSACSINGGDNGSQVSSSDGKCWLAAFPQAGIDVREFGAKCDDSTDDTAALQAAINAAKGAGTTTGAARYAVLVHGVCQHAGLTVNRPLRIAGDGNQTAYLKLRPGSTVPDITVSCAYDAANYYVTSGTTCDVVLENLWVGSANRSDASGQGVAHGISLVQNGTNPIYTRVVVNNIRCIGVPGDCLHGTGGWQGWVEAGNFYFWLPGGYGIYANSVTDWLLSKGTIDGAILDGFLCSACSGVRLSEVNIFSSVRNNVELFGLVDWACTDCFIDLAGRNGVYVNTTAGSSVRLANPFIRWSSQSLNNGYGDIYFEAASAGNLNITAGHFAGSPNPFGSGFLPLWNLYIDAATVMNITWDTGTVFEFGKPGIAGRTVSDISKTSPAGVFYREFTSATNLAANTTYYFGPAGLQTVLGTGIWSSPSQCVALGFTLGASVAPGAGESFVGTLMANNVAQTMTGSISGASANSVAVAGNPVVFSQFDTMQLRVVTSTTAAAGQHAGAVKMICP